MTNEYNDLMLEYCITTPSKINDAFTFGSFIALPAIKVKKLSVTTKLNKIVEPSGDVPVVIPTGLEGRIASVDGTYMFGSGNSLPCKGTDAIRVALVDGGNYPELIDPGNTVWLIDKVASEENGQQPGEFSISLQLRKVWKAGESRLKIGND